MSEECVVVDSKPSRRDAHAFYNSLLCLVKALEGTHTLIDLRNESCISGKIVKVDGQMNIEMEDAVFYNSKGNEHVFPVFFVRQRNIRYVHIPSWLPSKELIEKQLKAKPPARSRKQHTFKRMRAKRYTKEIVQSAYKKKS